MKTALTVPIMIVMVFGMSFTTLAGGGNYINISTTRKYVVGWTKGRYIVQNGKTIYIQGKPIFATKTTGFSVNLGRIAVKDHGITLKISFKQVDAKDFIADAGGNTMALAKARHFTINGRRSKLLGKHGGRAYFRQANSRKVVSAALVTDGPAKSKGK